MERSNLIDTNYARKSLDAVVGSMNKEVLCISWMNVCMYRSKDILLIYLPDPLVRLATMSHAALDLGRVEMATLPGGHGCGHFARSHAFKGLGHVPFAVILGITTLKVGNDAVEGPAFNGQVRRLVDLVGDGFAPLPPMVIVFVFHHILLEKIRLDRAREAPSEIDCVRKIDRHRCV